MGDVLFFLFLYEKKVLWISQCVFIEYPQQMIAWRYIGINHKSQDSNYTLENHCTRTAQSSRGGCSRRVHKIVYTVVNKGNILVIFYF